MDHLISFFSEIMIFNLESIAVLFSILYVILVARENIWCWAAAIISVSLYIFICYEAKLYAETGLQFFYLIMAVIGFLFWKVSADKKQLNIKELKKQTFYKWLKSHDKLSGQSKIPRINNNLNDVDEILQINNT